MNTTPTEQQRKADPRTAKPRSESPHDDGQPHDSGHPLTGTGGTGGISTGQRARLRQRSIAHAVPIARAQSLSSIGYQWLWKWLRENDVPAQVRGLHDAVYILMDYALMQSRRLPVYHADLFDRDAEEAAATVARIVTAMGGKWPRPGVLWDEGNADLAGWGLVASTRGRHTACRSSAPWWLPLLEHLPDLIAHRPGSPRSGAP